MIPTPMVVGMLLLFNHASNVTIRHMPLEQRRHQIDVSTGRHLVPPKGETYESPVVARTAPYLFVNVKRSDDDFDTAEWRDIVRVDLVTGNVAPVFTPSDLPPHAWITELVRVSDDGTTLTVVYIGPDLKRAIADIDLATKRLTPVISL